MLLIVWTGVAWKWVTFALSAVPLSPLEIVDTLCAMYVIDVFPFIDDLDRYQSNSECQCQYALSLLYLLTSSILESIRKWVGDNILNVALVPDFSTKIETLNTYIMTKEPESHLLALVRTPCDIFLSLIAQNQRKDGRPDGKEQEAQARNPQGFSAILFNTWYGSL